MANPFNLNIELMSILQPGERLSIVSKLGSSLRVEPIIPVRRYYRSGIEMLRMANIYNAEGDRQSAYILYLRYLKLFMEQIRLHPDYHQIRGRVRELRPEIYRDILPRTENLRLGLLERYKREYKLSLTDTQSQQIREQLRINKHDLKSLSPSATGTSPRSVSTSAVGSSRQTSSPARSSDYIPPALTVTPPSGASYSGSPETSTSHPSTSGTSPKTKRRSRSRSILPSSLRIQMDAISQPDLSILDTVVYPDDFPSTSSRSNLPSTGLLLADDDDRPGPSTRKSLSPSSKPPIDRSTKPGNDSPKAKSGPLPVVLPSDTMEVFLQHAAENTANNIETCGLLVGTFKQFCREITHIIIPKQIGTADSCSTIEEELIFGIKEIHECITFGWIHTHPTQTAFLSSIDLHTQCAYQTMMPEAIAIVCAPKYNTNAFFVLTPHYGLTYIAQCRQSGFHPHPKEPPLYKEATHVVMNPHYSINVIDLRYK